MNHSGHRTASLLVTFASVAALAALSAGCEPIGCFEASEAGGRCPAQQDALEYFGDPDCGGRVASVDSGPSPTNGEPGEGTLCCYSITIKDPEYPACPDFK